MTAPPPSHHGECQPRGPFPAAPQSPRPRPPRRLRTARACVATAGLLLPVVVGLALWSINAAAVAALLVFWFVPPVLLGLADVPPERRRRPPPWWGRWDDAPWNGGAGG